jgi:hypothetical protein
MWQPTRARRSFGVTCTFGFLLAKLQLPERDTVDRHFVFRYGECSELPHGTRRVRARFHEGRGGTQVAPRLDEARSTTREIDIELRRQNAAWTVSALRA